MRINKFLSMSLGVSRRKADDLINSSKVKVNSNIAKPGQNVNEEDKVFFNGEVIEAKQESIYLMLNKPTGFVCSREGQGSKTIYTLLPSNFHSLKYIGRLDKDSTGLLLLTNDGDFINKLTHPRYQKVKKYEVRLDKPLKNEDQLLIAKQGVMLDDGLSKFDVTTEKDKIIAILTEGRNRQVRRTFEKLGYKVTALHRKSFGEYSLSGLEPGEYKLVEKRI